MKFYESIFESQFDIGDPVMVNVDGKLLYGHVRNVLFTNCKVRYAVKIESEDSTLHNLDSVLVIPWPDGSKITWTEPDNNS